MNFRSGRFLIDKFDSKLRSAEKELKLDKVVIGVSVVLMVAFAVILALCSNAHPALSIISILMIIFSAALIVLMVKEYLEDLKKLRV